MKKKIIILFLIVLLGRLILPQVIFAATYRSQVDSFSCTTTYEGLVPCGKKATTTCPGFTTSTMVYCQFCHFFVMIDGIFDFVLIYIIPPIAVLMLVIGGIMFYFAGGNPNLLSQGKNLIKYAIIGIFIAYGSFLIVGFLLNAVGAANMSPIKDVWQNGVFTINCPIEL